MNRLEKNFSGFVKVVIGMTGLLTIGTIVSETLFKNKKEIENSESSKESNDTTIDISSR